MLYVHKIQDRHVNDIGGNGKRKKNTHFMFPLRRDTNGLGGRITPTKW